MTFDIGWRSWPRRKDRLLPSVKSSPGCTANVDHSLQATAVATPPIIDAEAVTPSGTLCPACATPIEPLDKFCAACGTTNPDYHQPTPTRSASEAPAAPASKHFKCQQCGAEVATDPDQRSYVCPFCDSTY